MSAASNTATLRFSIDVCIATDDLKSAERLWCSVNDLLEEIPGVFPQGGYFGPMPAEDIIPDSPLARYLEQRGASGL